MSLTVRSPIEIATGVPNGWPGCGNLYSIHIVGLEGLGDGWRGGLGGQAVSSSVYFFRAQCIFFPVGAGGSGWKWRFFDSLGDVTTAE